MAALPLMKRPLKRGSAAWLAARRNHGGLFRIGSSDAPLIVLGAHHGRTPLDLWLEKLGHALEKGDLFDLRQGRDLEDICAAEAGRLLGATGRREGPGVRVRRRRAILVHPNHPWMTASLDRVLSGLTLFDGEPLEGPGVLECKCPRYAGMLRVKNQGPPPAALIQILHQLAVTGWGFALCAHYHRDFGALLHLVLRRGHEKLIQEIIRREQAFLELLQEGRPPRIGEAPAPLDPLPACQKSSAWREDPIWRAALKRLEHAALQRERGQAAWEVARQDTQFLMGSSEEVRTPWGAVSWKPAKPASRLDARLLRAELAASAHIMAAIIQRPLEAPGADRKRLSYARADMAALLNEARGLPRLVERARKDSAPGRPFIVKFEPGKEK